jgi:UrcA family protein
VLAAGIVSSVVLGAAAMPAAAAEAPWVAVSYSDLDINSQAGAEKLYERIVRAAAQVCPLPETSEMMKFVAMTQCRHQAVARAVSSVRSPQLASVYTSRTHRALQSPA